MRYRVRLIVASIMSITVSSLAIGAVANAAVPQVKRGSLTVVTESTQWPGLDPATNTQDAIDTQIMNAIYGQLFELSPSGVLTPNLATGYKFSNHNLTVTIGIRKGVKFQDGTAFNAAAVAANITRVLEPQYGCLCDSDWAALKSVTTSGSYNVVLNLSKPFAPIVHAFVGEAPNWVVSPTALASEPEATFAQMPIGAGPGEVVSNSASAEIVLKRFAGYWQKGDPGWNTLTFLNVGSDESEISAIKSGEAQIALNMVSPQIIKTAKPKFNVCVKPPSTSNVEELNTKLAPFNNILAREAVTYATNATQLLKTVGDSFGKVSKIPNGPSSDFYAKGSFGYRAYNLAKAKSLVQQLGGLSFTYLTINSPGNIQNAEAFQAQMQAAGINLTIDPISLQTEIGDFIHNSWQATGSALGGNDPGYSIFGYPIRLESSGLFSGVANPAFDSLINRAASLVNPTARLNLYKQIYTMYNAEAYGPETYGANVQLVAAKNVGGICNFPVFAIEPIINWENISYP